MITEKDVTDLRNALNQVWVFGSLLNIQSLCRIELIKFSGFTMFGYSIDEKCEVQRSIDHLNCLDNLCKFLLHYDFNNEAEPEIVIEFFTNLCRLLHRYTDHELREVREILLRRDDLDSDSIKDPQVIVLHENPYQNKDDVVSPDYKLIGNYLAIFRDCLEFRNYDSYLQLWNNLIVKKNQDFVYINPLEIGEVETNPESYALHMIAENWKRKISHPNYFGKGSFMPFLNLNLLRSNLKWTIILMKYFQELKLKKEAKDELFEFLEMKPFV